MENFRNNTKIEESDIILTEENTIGPIYHTEEEKKIKFMDSKENINIKKEENISSQNQNSNLHNEDESFPKNAYILDSNKDNKEINESEKDVNNLSANLPQNNLQIDNKINQEINENNEPNNDYNERNR